HRRHLQRNRPCRLARGLRPGVHDAGEGDRIGREGMTDRVWLFSYGTLQQEGVQLATFGRRLEGRADALPGYSTSPLEITDADVIAATGKTHHLIALPTGNPADEVGGVAFALTPAELA